LASDKAALREKIAPKILESLSTNGRNADLLGLDTIKIFEIGNIFPATGEKTSICIGVSQVKKKKGVTAESVLKESIAALESELAISLNGTIEVTPQGAIIEADFGAIIANLQSGDIRELSFTALPGDKKYIPFSQYPYITRDIALFVPSGISDGDVSNTIKRAAVDAAGKILVKGPVVFDRFEKEGKVSYAFRMIFQSFEKTLSDDEVNGYMTQVYTAAKAKGWEVR
jgi:phenylalanyl-tRNA synthetase beta subunit